MRLIDRLSPAARALLDWLPLQYMLDHIQARPRSASVYADDAAAPTRCCVLLGHFLFMGGTMDAPFIDALKSDVLTPETRRKTRVLVMPYPDDAAAQLVKSSFDTVFDNERTLFRYDTDAPPPLQPASAPAAAPITAALLRSGIENADMIINEVLGTGTYDDMDAFCRDGLGFTHVVGNRVTAFCTSEYQSEKAVAIGIEVEEAQQRKGVATAMTRAFLRAAAARFDHVYWECWKRNGPSAATAEKCGFRKVADYPILFIPLVPKDTPLS